MARQTTSIRIDVEVLHQGRVAALTVRKTLGVWLEEAIREKIGRQTQQQEEATELAAEMLNRGVIERSGSR